MEFSEVLNYVLYIVLTANLPVIATYAVNFIKTKIKESNAIINITKNEHCAKIIEDALSNVMDAVLYVNQVYTDALKAENKFDKESQKTAFNRAYEEAANMISAEAKNLIETLYGSFDRWLRVKIESSVNMAKKQ